MMFKLIVCRIIIFAVTLLSSLDGGLLVKFPLALAVSWLIAKAYDKTTEPLPSRHPN